MNLYQLKLRSASFRGVRFSVTESDYTTGRRTAVHQYPKRDTPYVEDMGRAVRQYDMTIYVVGTDYIERTKKLMEALEAKGAGKLVHPWLGELTVTATSVGTATFTNSLGLATIQVSFIEAGELQNPKGATNWLSQLRAKVDSTLTTAADEFANMINLDGVSDIVSGAADDAWGIARSVLAQDSFLKALGVVNKVASVPTTLLNLNPKGFATQVVSASGLYSFVGVFNGWRDMSKNLSKMSKSSTLSKTDTSSMVVDSTAKLIAENTNAINDFTRTLIVANAAGAASVIGTDDDVTDATAIPVSYDSLIDTRDSLLEAIDSQILATGSDNVSESLEGLRTSVFYELTERARDNARLIDIPAAAKTPLVVVAYNQYEDADRADELATINAVRHIGFSPYGGLKGLSR